MSMNVDLKSAYNGWVRFRSGYCCYAHIHGDQDREGAYVVSTERDFGLVRNRVFGLFCSDGKSYWDQWPEKNRVIPFDQEIVTLEPDELRPKEDD